MKLYGKEIGKNELLKRVGDISQIGHIKMYELTDGASRGVRAADLKTPSGIDMSIIMDRGMDISSLTYHNIPISWRSVTRETSPYYYNFSGMEWLRTFFGGLLTTCGLDNIGGPCTDQGEELGLHGRISNLSAERVCQEVKWEGDTYWLQVSGVVRQVKVFGEKLELKRKISAFMDSPKIIIEDEVENIGFNNTPLMILYHINIGYPIIDEGAKLLGSKAKVRPRDREAEKGLGSFNEFSPPVKGFKEQVFFHDIEEDGEGNSNIAIVNEGFNAGSGLGIWLKYSKKTLPNLIQWKQMGEGEYVCGIEPSNSLIRGRAKEREENNLKHLEPGQVEKFKLEINILSSNDEIELFRKEYC
jgi:hypothetical protein